jgi:hypothetical protein
VYCMYVLLHNEYMYHKPIKGLLEHLMADGAPLQASSNTCTLATRQLNL